MALKLTKNKSIILTSTILVLSAALGFLVWRVNQPEVVSPTDSEASEYDAQCVGADLVVSVEKNVCAPDFKDQTKCPPHQTVSVNVTGIPAGSTARYQVKGVVVREYPETEGQCQPKEIFHLELGGVKGRVSQDNSNCNMNSQFEDLSPIDSLHPYFTFKPGSNTIDIYSDALKTDEGYPNSVYLANVCLYAINKCGDGVVELDEECEPVFTTQGEAGSCDIGMFCNDSCKCEATPPTCGDGIKNGTEACDFRATPTGCATNYTCNTSCTCDAPSPTCGNGTLDPGEQCENYENGMRDGAPCTWAQCNQSTCRCLPGDLKLTKTVVETCVDKGTTNPKSELVYTITLTNNGAGPAEPDKIEDVLDSKILAAGIVPTILDEDNGGLVNRRGIYSEGKILWDFNDSIYGTLGMSPGTTFQTRYKVVINKANFGNYKNTAKLTNLDDTTLIANANIDASCLETIPQTGIFDSTLGRISVGFVLLLIGGVVYNLPSGIFIPKTKEKNIRYRIRFESKMSKK